MSVQMFGVSDSGCVSQGVGCFICSTFQERIKKGASVHEHLRDDEMGKLKTLLFMVISETMV